ncbi:HNH endonuclease signature motif containing protein [Pseudomonas syringae]|uniref:HNH endonuclease signature motif containing protein n=1 Tax=Pseudomonas syringae TaxID=317 RepID=UPI0011AEFE12|nr:HNH endonuclease signature motif containing protein [Pseudomonas syringae]
MGTALEDLRPIGKCMIIDCVQSAGIDVRAWGFRKKDGQPVTLPQSNGGYCYEWSFRSVDGRILLLCVWFEEIDVDSQGRVCFVGNLRAYADTLIQQLEKDPKNRSRTIKDPRINRAQHFNSTVQLAHMNSMTVRVVIVSGPIRESDDIDADNDRAVGRYLDEESWRVENFDDDTGVFVVVRGDNLQLSIGEGTDPADMVGSAGETGDFFDDNGRIIVDQFHAELRSVAYTYKGEQKYRDPRVRALVLARSKGLCELTSLPGFKMANGGVYLETHHIVPLSEGGPDVVENVIALSADAHRRAHHAVGRDELRQQCFDVVASHYV